MTLSDQKFFYQKFLTKNVMFWRNFSSKITCILRPKLPLEQHEGRAAKNGCRKTVKNWEPEYSLEILRTTHFLSAIFGNESDTILLPGLFYLVEQGVQSTTTWKNSGIEDIIYSPN